MKWIWEVVAYSDKCLEKIKKNQGTTSIVTAGPPDEV